MYTREDYDRFDEYGEFIPYKPTDEELTKKDEIKKVLEQELSNAYEPDSMDDYVGYDSTNERIDAAFERVAKQFNVDTDFVYQIAGEAQSEEYARIMTESEWIYEHCDNKNKFWAWQNGEDISLEELGIDKEQMDREVNEIIHKKSVNSSHKMNESSYTSWDDFYKKGCKLGLSSYMNSLDKLHDKYGRFRDVPKEELSSVLKSIPDDKDYETFSFIEDMLEYFDWYDIINSSSNGSKIFKIKPYPEDNTVRFPEERAKETADSLRSLGYDAKVVGYYVEVNANGSDESELSRWGEIVPFHNTKISEQYGHTDDEYNFIVDGYINKWLETKGDVADVTNEEIDQRRKRLEKHVREIQGRSVGKPKIEQIFKQAAKKSKVKILDSYIENEKTWEVTLDTEDEYDADAFRNNIDSLLGGNSGEHSYDDITGHGDVHIGTVQVYEYRGENYEDMDEDIRDKYVVYCEPFERYKRRRELDW